MPAQTVIQIRRDTAANWTSTNPTLASGEIGFETNTNKLKIGNGSTAWTSLAYASGADVDWADITGKPTTFDPSAHASSHGSSGSDAITIAQSQVTDLGTALSGKADTSHTHAMADLTSFTITDPVNGQTLVYDSGTSKWINSAAAAGGETISSFLLMGA
jgi:hypothetical protein